jgi:hypothetical protein
MMQSFATGFNLVLQGMLYVGGMFAAFALVIVGIVFAFAVVAGFVAKVLDIGNKRQSN